MSFSSYGAYKETNVAELGEVPAHWNVVPLKYVVETPITDGPHETPEFIDDGIPFVSAEAVSSGEINFSKSRFISHADHHKYSKKYKPRRNDIFMVKSGATTGVVALVSTDRDFNIWSPLAVVRCSRLAFPRYVLQAMRSRNFQESVILNWSFGTQQNIGMSVIENLRIPLPPIPEQTQIAHFLDHETARIDALIEEQQRLIELLKEKRQAVISHAVTKGLDPTVPMKDSDVEWLGEVPAHWGVVSISRIFEIRAGGDLKTEFYSDVQTESHKHPIFTNATNESAIYGYTSKAIFPGGTITVTGRGDVGYAIFRSQPYDAIIRLLVLKPVRDVQAKLYAYMVNAVLTFSVGSSAISQLSAEQIAPYKVLLPPIGEQTEILALLDQATMEIDALVNEAHGVISLLQERRSALISAAVTGKIDVRSWQPPASAPTPELAQEAV
ncbi:MAG: restriction endonuclease subunit S [Pseudomonas sp.]|nr:restriction endonuclease subunit S [Pseudomonas sp.]|tara:strand:- start:37851 stop:39173 length:1323 start_codon:yes stop_codon:yes gene_type:complete